MIEQKALAYANMYGVLGALEKLCELDSKAKEILKEITQKYTHIPYKKYGNDYIKQNQVYEMPKE